MRFDESILERLAQIGVRHTISKTKYNNSYSEFRQKKIGEKWDNNLRALYGGSGVDSEKLTDICYINSAVSSEN
jgi:hypothetical protein